MTKRKKKILNGDTYTADSSGKVSSPPLNEAGRFLQIGVSSGEVSRLPKTRKKEKKEKLIFQKGEHCLVTRNGSPKRPKPSKGPSRVLKG